MGEATPAQSAAGSFVPMLGVGLGSMSAAGVGTSRGSAVPQLHNAIVERLRARFELCRRHHSTCENRYQRGQAETTDREHESTLHLLNIVQQGPGNRKSKASRGSNQQPPEYSRANGEPRGPDGDHKASMRMALHGSLRRKIEGQAPKQSNVSCAFPGSNFKRARMEGANLGPGPMNLNPCHSFQGSSNMNPQRKNFMMSHGVASDVFNMTLKEMKKEPIEVQSCGQSSADMIFDFKDEGQLDPELQDLFDELTKSASPLNDLEFEKMLKQDDTFGLDLGRPSSVGAVGGLVSPLDKPIKLEHSPDFGHVNCGSPQLRPASAGPAFALAGASSSGTSQKVQSGPARSMPCWPEISHAEQLKQMAAANQQQPNSLLHHHQAPTATMSGWSHSSSASFQDNLPGPAPLSRISPQSKGINNCLFKSNGHSGAHHLDVKALSTKPTLHFSPKPTHATSQTLTVDPLSKSSTQQQQQQSSSSSQHSLHYQNQQISTSASLCLQNKTTALHVGGLPFKMSQQRQGSPSGPRQPVNGSLVPPPPRPPAANSQLKTPALQRPLHPPAHLGQDKDGPLDQFSRHLTRPPPEYKHSRTLVQQQGNMFTGPNSGPDKELPSCHVPHKMNPSPDRRFDCPPGSCAGQFQQHNGQRLGPGQNKPRFLSPNAPGGPFGINNVQQSRGAGEPGLGGLMTNMSWGSVSKQAGPVRRPSGLLQSSGAPSDLYQQRHIGPPNQVAPDPRMLPAGMRDTGSRPGQAAMGSAPAGLSRSSPEQRVPAGNFPEPGSGSGNFQGGRANRVTFDFLPEGDNTVPGINTDSDFIDSLLKSGSGTDDWMKDINLDEILGSGSII